MRFKLGPVPEDEDFDPEADGWTLVREPRTGVLMLLAVPLGVVIAGLLMLLWVSILPVRMPTASSEGFSIDVNLWQLLGFAVAVVGFVLLHEVLHVIPAVVAGGSKDVVIGFWPKYFAPYVAFTGTLSRNVQLLSGVMPFLALTVVPIPLAMLFPQAAWWLVALSVVNALGSGADVIMVALLARQVPSASIVRNHGPATYWRAVA
ncbi:MAG: DUF3267 domain-containing protein [Coriobacteriia bacterium]